jgi:hypothetical protein
VFARIKARDSKAGPTIDRLTKEHELLRDIGETTVRELDDIVNGSILPRERIETTAREYIDGLRAHMRIEETVVLPLAARLLSEADWSNIDAAIATFDDPLFGSEVQDRYDCPEAAHQSARAGGQGDGASVAIVVACDRGECEPALTAINATSIRAPSSTRASCA